MPTLNSLINSPRHARPEIELPRADSFVDVELGHHSLISSGAAVDHAEQPASPQRNRRRIGWALGTLFVGGAVAAGIGGWLGTRHPHKAPSPSPLPALPPSLVPASAPVPAPQPGVISAPVPQPQPGTVPTPSPAPAPAQLPGLSPPPPPVPSLATQPHSDAFQLTPYAKPQSSGQVVAGEFLTLVVSTNGNACGQVRRDPTHTLVLQMARPLMGTLTPGTYGPVANAAAPEDMASISSAPAGQTGLASVAQAFGSTATSGDDLQVQLTSVSHAGGNFTGSFSLTLNGQRQRGDFNAAACTNLYGGV